MVLFHGVSKVPAGVRRSLGRDEEGIFRGEPFNLKVYKENGRGAEGPCNVCRPDSWVYLG